MIRSIIAVASLALIATPAFAQTFSRAARPAATMAVSAPVTANERIDLAKRALEQGEFDMARRHFGEAIALDREAGLLPAEATFGLVHVLYAQSYNREAAFQLDRLATDAARMGNDNVEARALADAMWLKAEEGQLHQARADAYRLRALLKKGLLTEETKQFVLTRLG